MELGNQEEKGMPQAVLVGNTFPPALIRRRAVFEPAPLGESRRALGKARVVSFWGHASTVRAASALAEVDLTPTHERPALSLSPENLPSLAGEIFQECWVLSPNYVPGYRPAIGEEVPAEKITGWQVLRISFPANTP